MPVARRTRPALSRLKPPAELADFQRWFGTEVSRPLRARSSSHATRAFAPEASDARESQARLRGVNGLDGHARLDIYNRQYWYRLVTILQDEYPCAVHLLGLEAFNGWAVRYLMAHPPASPYLADMDAGFPAFVGRRLRASRGTTAPKALQGAEWRAAVREALAYDKALSRAIDAPDGHDAPGTAARGGAASAAGLASAHWHRAAHVTPLWLQWDFAAYRAACRADEALTGRIPLRRKGRSRGDHGGPRGHGVCLHRHEGTVYEKPLSRAEFLVLDALGTPRTLARVFHFAARGATPRDLRAMERDVPAWFKAWTERRWLSAIGG